MYMFLNGLTADYKQHVILHGATSFAEVQETCRRLDLAARTSQHTRTSALASVQCERGSSTGRKPTTSPRGPRPGSGPPRERTRFSERPRVKPGHVPRTAFQTKFGSFQFRVMPFGLCNAPSIFQRTMNNLLADCRRFADVYIDDIFIYSRTLD